MKAIYLTCTGDTTTNLPLPLHIEGYGVGLIEIHGKIEGSKLNNWFLCADICEDSIVGENRLPILRSIHRKQNGTVINDEMYHVIWLKVVRPHINSIRLYICNELGDIIPLGKNSLTCTLLFIPPKSHKHE